MAPVHAPQETERLQALQSYAILDTPAEEAYDQLATLAAFGLHEQGGHRQQRQHDAAAAQHQQELAALAIDQDQRDHDNLPIREQTAVNALPEIGFNGIVPSRLDFGLYGVGQRGHPIYYLIVFILTLIA